MDRMDTYRHNKGGGALICKGYDYSKTVGAVTYVYV